LVETTVRDAHAPNKVQNIQDVFLMRFGSEDDGRTPRSITLTDPTVAEENEDMLHDDLALVRPVMRFLATDRRRAAGVDSEFKMEDGKLDASGVEAVPMRLDDGDDGGADGGSDGWPNNKILGELVDIAVVVPQVDVGARIGEWCRRMTDGTTVLFKEEYALIDVVAVVHGNVLIGRLGAPKFGRNSNDKRAGGTNRSRIVEVRKLRSRESRRVRSSSTEQGSSSAHRASQSTIGINKWKGGGSRGVCNLSRSWNELWKFFVP
jgi:hypothetical protein